MKKQGVYTVKTINTGSQPCDFPSNSVWESAETLNTFHQPWGEEDCPQIQFKALHDSQFLYLRYKIQDTNVLLFYGSNEKMDVTKSDRVEIFMAKDPALQTYYCLEIDPSGRILDYSASYHRNFNYHWTWPEGTIFVETDIEVTGYKVDVKISKESLQQLGLLNNHIIHAGIYLGHCASLPKTENMEVQFNWLTWIDPKLDNPDFHVPASFGILELKGPSAQS